MNPRGDVDQMVRSPQTAREIEDIAVYRKMATAERTKGHLAASEQKRLSRARIRLIKAGVMKQITRVQLEEKAREAYGALPFWKRWSMLIRFHVRRWWITRQRKKLSDGK